MKVKTPAGLVAPVPSVLPGPLHVLVASLLGVHRIGKVAEEAPALVESVHSNAVALPHAASEDAVAGVMGICHSASGGGLIVGHSITKL